ncbi:hypothetical protein [Methanoregula sp.]|jgi:hypothetical protein|uniref:hypothetical protein n=1 Tax=Methanoregula sp. TaxID=2052170 RepID=UPI003C1C2E97
MALTLREEHGLAIFLILMFLIPCVMIIFVAAEVPYSTVSGEPVKDAAIAAGITVTSVKDSTWNLPGATGGKTYVLSDTAGNTVTISTQSFDSADSRDAVIRLYNAHPVGRGHPVGSLIVLGSQLIYVTPANSEILNEIGPALRNRLK